MKSSLPPPEAEATFRRKLVALARARDESTITDIVAELGERFDRPLFNLVWQQEEVKRRKLSPFVRYARPIGVILTIVTLTAVALWLFRSGTWRQQGAISYLILCPMTYVVCTTAAEVSRHQISSV